LEGEYRDALSVLRQNEESPVLVEEGNWDEGMEEVRKKKMRVSLQVGWLILM